ncbi:MAG: DUF192 domain-containing protein [Armatimonadetes bacterium]|nr:DUF192 domain-containing protein [Armatimonadota bacterium]
MSKSWIAALTFGLALSGCNGNAGSANGDEYPVSNNQPTTATNNEPSTNSASNSDSNAASNNEPSKPSTKPSDPNNNASRLYQLKDLPKIKIKTPGGDLNLWVMDTESKRQEGMMFLVDREVKDNEGMIFVFPEAQKKNGNYGFWMHNTILPLDIDYISKDKKLINVGKGVPFSDDQVKTEGDYLYVIEVKQGMSGKFGLNPGATVDIPSNLVGKP